MPAINYKAMNKSIPKGWLWVARILVLAIGALALIVYIVGTPVYFAQLVSTQHCIIQDCPSPTIVNSLHSMGIPITTYAAYMTALNLLFALVYFVVAAFIFWRKSDDWMALLACLALVTFGASFPGIPGALAAVHPAWWLPVTIVGNEDVLGFPSLFVFFFLFPNARFVPRWTGLAAFVSVALFELTNFFPNGPPNLSRWTGLLLFLVPLLVVGSLVYAQIYRYRRVSTPVERQQTKWIVFGTAAALLGFLLLGYLLPAILTVFMPFKNIGLLPYLIALTAIMLVLLLIPLSLAFAILRYRLWDVDVIINKTLVYGLLSGILVAVYVGLILGLQALLHGIISQDNGVAIVISTLAIAALFQPLRRRIQKIIDRRFYRSKYDAAKIVAAFSATLREEIELSQLSEQLVAVVQETMQPTHVSLWLRPLQQDRDVGSPSKL
jgi:hypothetical protein